MTLQRWALGSIGAIGLGALLTLAGCPANLEDPQRFADGGAVMVGPDAVPTCVTQLFSVASAKCSTAVCHLAGSTSNSLDLSSSNVAMRLINVNATHDGVDLDGGGVTCPTAKLIDTSTPAASWLLVKINGMQGSCGSQMPLIGSITSTDKACLTNWVDSLASDAGTSGGSGGAATTGGSGGATTIGGSGGASTSGGSGGAAGSGASGASAGGSGGKSGGASAGTGGM
jgi:hypothetical protein